MKDKSNEPMEKSNGADSNDKRSSSQKAADPNNRFQGYRLPYIKPQMMMLSKDMQIEIKNQNASNASDDSGKIKAVQEINSKGEENKDEQHAAASKDSKKQ